MRVFVTRNLHEMSLIMIIKNNNLVLYKTLIKLTFIKLLNYIYNNK